MRKYTLELDDALGSDLESAAKDDHRTVEAYIALQLHYHVNGHAVGGRVTEAELKAYRAAKISTTRIPITANARNRIFERCEGKCAYCQGTILYSEPFHIDHIVPLVKGGSNDESNLTLACVLCNARKGGKLLAVK